jgi:DnaJ-domain-containing protein 1
MSLEYSVAILFCLAIGYWGVSWLIDKLNASAPLNGQRQKTSAREEAGKDYDASNNKEPPQGIDKWFIVLGVSATASADEIKKAYRHKLNLYHPDRVANLGDELRTVAEEKTKKINAAYAEAVKSSGVF